MRPKSAQNQQTVVAWIVSTPRNRSIYAADAARHHPSHSERGNDSHMGARSRG